MWLPKLSRKLHRWGAALTALPVVVILVTGVVLQLKKEIAWIQPSTHRGTTVTPTLSFEQVLEIARKVPEAEIETWGDIDRLDVRPGKGMLKVRAKNSWEVQIDTATGDVLQVAYRRSDLIESIHDGSFFADAAKLWLFLPAGLILLGLWVTGVYLWLLPYIIRRRRLKKSKLRELQRAARGVQGKLILCAIGPDGTVCTIPSPLSGTAQQVARATAEMYGTAGFEEPWIGYLAVLDGSIVGTCGFKTPPRTGRVEIAYFTFPDFEGRGIATAMASALLALAREQRAETLVAAQTLPDRNASHRILEKLGFRHVDTVQHPEDGTVWEWQA